MTTNYLHNLNTKELLLILRHVQHGHDYLSKKLTKNEYRYLLSIGSLSNNQISKLESDKQEKIGNVSVVVNTILTSCFGAWLGFNAFTQNSIISIFGLVIIFLGMGFGFLTGYLSYLLTHRQARLAYKNQQLCNVARVIIEIIINKRQNKIESTRQKIYTLLQNLELNTYKHADISEKKIFDSLRNLSVGKVEKPYANVLKKIVANIKRSIKKLTLESQSKTTDEELSFNSADFMLNNTLTNASYIKILTKTDLPSKHQIPKVNAWLRRNMVGILVGLLPTFLGSFASMFVFLNGFPAFLTGIGINFGFSETHIYILKEITLMVAFGISVYFAYSHIHSNYKAFKRAQLLEMSENLITEKTNYMIQLMSQLNHWTKIYYHVQLINDFKSHSNNEIFKIASANHSIESLYNKMN